MAERQAVIEFQNFSFQYFAQASPTISDISLSIYEGETVLIVGPSGSGKSTLGNCINGLIPFSYKGTSEGSCKICGRETSGQSIFEISKKVGTVLQDPDGQFIGLSVAEDIAFALENQCVGQAEMKEIVKKTAQTVDMGMLLNSSPFELSGGQKQRVSFAGVMVDDVEVLLFDEPLANLDPATGKTAIDLIDRIKEEYNKTVVIIEHRLEDVLYRNIDRIIVVSDGRIAADMSPDKLMEQALLPKLGIREPLYVTAMRYAGVCVTEDLCAGRLATLKTEKIREAVVTWNDGQIPLKEPDERPEILRAEQINFSYGGRRKILKNINFSIQEGEMVSIVGTNGAGKSTLAKAICALVKGVEGSFYYKGESLDGKTIKERARYIGYVMQNPNQMICKPMIHEEVALGLRLRGMKEEEIVSRVERVLKTCGLYEFRKWPISALSFGQKKRVTIASMLVLEPQVLILDEPTAGQDYYHYTEIMEFLQQLNEKGVTILLITHDMHLMLEYTPHAIVVNDGQILYDGSSVHALTTEEIADAASLKITSLYELAGMCGIRDRQAFVRNFIDYERRNAR
ncbi:MAG: ABC transporter ATP-binding protein [Lachnospiraceae bacterium]